MPATKGLTPREIETALAKLNRLSFGEYGVGLERLLHDDSPDAALRIQRLTGIALKRPFARPSKPRGYTRTGARRSWPWKKTSPAASANKAPKQYKVLNQLRQPGPWNERKPLAGTSGDSTPISWDTFKDDVDHERGLFKVLALYVEDKLKGRGRKTLKEYLDAKESPRFEAGLSLAANLAHLAVLTPLVRMLGLPADVAIGLALVGVQYGYRMLTDPNAGRVGDNRS